MFKQKFLMCLMVLFLIFTSLPGCDVLKQFVGGQTDTLTPEKALKIAEQGEAFYSKAKTGIASYIEANPTALTEEQKVKLTTAVNTFEFVYKNGQSAISKVYAVKGGQQVTLSDIKDECIIIAAEYIKLKQIIKPLLGNTIAYPDEVTVAPLSNDAAIKIEEVVSVPTEPVVVPEPTSKAEPMTPPTTVPEAAPEPTGSPATEPAVPPAGTPTT